MRKEVEHRRKPVTRKFGLREFRERLGIDENRSVVRATGHASDVEVVMSPRGDDWPVYHYPRGEFLDRLGLPQVTWFSAFPSVNLFGYYVEITYFNPESSEGEG